MRLSIRYGGLTHHVVEFWRYAAKLHGVTACGVPLLQPVYDDDLLETPATCLHCVISPRSYRDTTYSNEDA